MKLKCNDGITRDFEVCSIGGWFNTYCPAYCKNCLQDFGVHDTKILKPLFKEHVCNSNNIKLIKKDGVK
jgi:hypothetical protein